MPKNIWEDRSYGFTRKAKPFKKDRNEEIDQLIDLGCNFLLIMDNRMYDTPFALEVLDTPYGIIHDYPWAIGASTFLMPNQDEAIVKIAKMVVDLAKVKKFCVEIYDSTRKMREVFWQLAQLEGLEVESFKPNELLINRLEKIRQFKNKIESRKNLSKEQNIDSPVINV